MSNGYLKFTGEYNKLKTMGYDFQKLYAANYMQWHKDGIRIFKRGATIEHGSINLYKLITFLRTKPAIRSYDTCMAFYKFYSNADINEYDYYPMTEENKKKYNENIEQWLSVTDDTPRDKLPAYLSTEIINKKTLEQLQELEQLGWYELIP